ncbi:hypothetical protein THMIRHAS_15150 [Thiosulfatimonas sediminis]|uniref:Uncharacterized protein n=1 Tax=Thiosulfatimonas sediminis TaxID=2675054 RepID=A0A6F8PVG7_9GAMM|nr:hypothetical protein [Thiosulfatimonas sediminis]BBP46142.1 hypothetical protein THMIRHAS_15150 [Thiosulfatimonas sediminis]
MQTPDGQLINSFIVSEPASENTEQLLKMIIENVHYKIPNQGVVNVTGLVVWKKALSCLKEPSAISIIPSKVAWQHEDSNGWMSRISASYNGASKEKHWSVRQKSEPLYIENTPEIK